MYRVGSWISFTSKDIEQIDNFKKALNIECHVGKKSSGSCQEKKYFVIQFRDVLLFDFLLSIGITPAKSKTIGIIDLPDEYFFDFLRGAFDGDGYSYSYFDPRWKSSFMFYMGFCSASEKHILWLQHKISYFLGIEGHITTGKTAACYQLKYAKKDSIKLIER